MTNTIHNAGESAYLDTFSGLIACTVMRVREAGHGQHATKGRIEVRIDQTDGKGGYKAGETLTDSAGNVVPSSHVKVRGGRFRVDVNYTWQ